MSTQSQPVPAPAAAQATAPAAEQQPSILDQVLEQPIDQDSQRFAYAVKFGEAAAKSQYWADAASISQAAMKIMAGYEFGISPVVALMHIHIIKGKVGLDGNLIATLLRKGGYTWKMLQQDEDGCELLFYKDGKMMSTLKRNPDGSVTEVALTLTFNRHHAEAADLTGPRGEDKPGQRPKEKGMYEKYPRNMYFNRCITNFQKWHAPEVSNGIAVYSYEELGAEVDANGGFVTGPVADAPAASQMPQRKAAEPTEAK